LELSEKSLKHIEPVLSLSNVTRIRIIDKALDGAIGVQNMDKALKYALINKELYCKYYSSYHPNLGVHFVKLGKIQLFLHQIPEALESLKEAYKIIKVTHGDSSSLLDNVRCMLEQCHYELGSSN